MAIVDAETAVGAEPSDETPSTMQRARQVGFALVAVATLGLAAVMMRAELLMAFTGWTEDLGIHQIHDLTIFSLLWIGVLAPMALALYRPKARVNTVLAPLVVLVPIAAFAFLADSPILMLPLIFGTLSLVALALHPAGRDLFRFDRVEHVDRALAGLLAVAAIPLLVYAGDQLVAQLTVADDHSLFAHYAAMAIASVYVVLMGSMAVFRERDWEFAAWSAGLVAVVVGLASVLFTVESSLGVVGGTLLVLFGVVFVAAVEYVRRFDAERAVAPAA